MKNFLFVSLACISFCMPVCAQTDNKDESQEDDFEEVCLKCCKEDEDVTWSGPHRIPPSIPVVYLNKTEFTIEFSNPCYETTLFVIDIRNGSVVYEIPVLDGLTQVCLPKSLNGEYELHLHRGCFCFSGIINL